MEDKNLNAENSEETTTPQIHVNDLGTTKDSTVVVEEADRTVLLTDNETIIIPKETMIDVPPKNRERKVYAGMWGTTELVTVGVAMLAILTTILLRGNSTITSRNVRNSTNNSRPRLRATAILRRPKNGSAN